MSEVTTDPWISDITAVYREELKGRRGFRFTDQNGKVLRKCATRPYTHVAIQSFSGGYSVKHLFLSFHSSPNPKPSYRTHKIERVIPIQEKAK
jgi:hypothetical protein